MSHYSDNAGQASEWTNLGSNTNSSIDLDTEGTNVGNVSIGIGVENEGINAQVRHECHVWLDYTDPIYTKHFNWMVNGDFSVMINAGNVNLDDPGDVDIDVQGSVNGTDYVKLGDGLTWDADTAATRIDHFVYDYDGGGRMPYMRIAFDCGTDNDNRNLPIKIVVVPH